MDLGLSPRFASSTGIPHLRFASISTDRRFPVGFTADSGSVAARRRPARCGSSRPPWLDGSISACVLDQGPMWIPEELAGAQTRAWLLVRPPQRAPPALASRPLANPVGGGWGRGCDRASRNDSSPLSDHAWKLRCAELLYQAIWPTVRRRRDHNRAAGAEEFELAGISGGPCGRGRYPARPCLAESDGKRD